MTQIQWETPPEHVLLANRGMPGRYLKFALTLREHPNEWAVLPSEGQSRTEKGAKATAQNIRRGKVKGFPKDDYEAVTDGQKIWVRYVGAPKAETQAETQPEQPEQPDEDEDDEQEDEVTGNGSLAPQIRQWGIDHGYDVPERGRLPRKLVDDFWQERGGQPPSHVRVVR